MDGGTGGEGRRREEETRTRARARTGVRDGKRRTAGAAAVDLLGNLPFFTPPVESLFSDFPLIPTFGISAALGSKSDKRMPIICFNGLFPSPLAQE